MSPTNGKVQVHVISHTHWDREWYLTREQYRLRLIDLVDGVLDRMDREPEFRYFHLDGQTIVLEDYLEVRPDQEERLRVRIREGRLLVGPWYVMPDMFLVSGESLVRNLALGHRLAESFGSVMRAGYMPDPFGHVAQMPQILAGFSLDNAILWRGFGGAGAEYRWEALDGTRALLLHLPKEGYCNALRLPLMRGDERKTAAAHVVARENARSSSAQVLLMAGVDHVEPHPALLDLVREIDAFAGTQATLSTLPAYVDSVRSALTKGELSPDVIHGELRAGEDDAHLLPGVLSARTYLKQSNVRAQALLEKTAEPLALFAWMAGEAHPTGVLAYAWRTLLQNHPHDSICGCSVDAVHDENETRFARVLEAGEGCVERALRALAKRIEPAPANTLRFLAVNTDIHPYAGLVETTLDLPIESAENNRFFDPAQFETPLAFFSPETAIAEITDPEGRAVPFQVLHRESLVTHVMSRVDSPLPVRTERWRVVCPVELPGTGFVAYDIRLGATTAAAKPGAAAVKTTPRSLENALLRVDVNDDGTLDVRDKRSGTVYHRVLDLEDAGDVGDEYNYSPPARDLRVTSRNAHVGSVRRELAGPLVGALAIDLELRVPRSASVDRIARDAAGASATIAVCFRIELRAGSDRLDVTARVTNDALDHRLRVLFSTEAPRTDTARADTAFGIVERPTRKPRPDGPLVETPVDAGPLQSFVDAGDARVGASVLSEGLMEYEVGGDGEATIALTLLRAVGFLSRDDLETRRGHAGPGLETPGAQCLGTREFRFAFVPRSSPPAASRLFEQARAFLAPPRTVVGTGSPNGETPPSLGRRHRFLALEDDPKGSVVLSALKRADEREAIIVRLFNPSDAEVVVQAAAEGGVHRTDLREQRLPEPAAAAGRVTVSPHRIETLELSRP